MQIYVPELLEERRNAWKSVMKFGSFLLMDEPFGCSVQDWFTSSV